MKKKAALNWDALSENAEKFLGEDFWNEMQHVIPKRGPAYDYFETSNEGVILIDLPGFTSKDHVHLSQQGTQLTIKGELAYPYSIPETELIHSERLKGKFKRVITLPFHFTTDNIHTSLQNGVLAIKITKQAEEEIVIRIHDD
ncbi:Hsp20/alpha crystallin family protein [Halobacillus sp. BBL2006]|uniref:Hsp20/alpha crystallin family protein n=1 Tax=Halobacillus sp. BBL2006 TaxID=1543706 RepID=UPI000541C004|nr:Hsp20/alpha crystallin family protein [Halobacillus sp. BBL2006]KHE71858.1 small heat shock protein [Halobacillus sp. BBL2006]